MPAVGPVTGLSAGPPTGAQAEPVTEPPPGPGGGSPRVALVAGTARGIGAATVAALAAAGWRVMAVDRCADDPALPYPLGRRAELEKVAADAGRRDPGAAHAGRLLRRQGRGDRMLRLVALLPGLVSLELHVLARRYLRKRGWQRNVLPDGFVPTGPRACSESSVRALVWVGINTTSSGLNGGPGAYLSGAIVALVVAAGFVPALGRTLLRHAYG